MFIPRGSSCRLVFVIVVAFSGVASAADVVSVTLQSGRHFTAEVAARTDADRLWLRFQSAGATLLRPIDWDRVVAARYKDQELTADELKALVPDLIANKPPELAIVSHVSTRPAPAADIRPVPAPAVRSVDFSARVANWDGHVAADGILLLVFPLDANGHAIPVAGSIEADLIGYRIKDFSAASQSRGYVLDRLGHWSQRISPEDLEPGGIRLKLPFQATQPENSQLGIYGLIHVRLVVPGQGVFESSQDAVRLRGFAPTRDILEQQRGRRFFPAEVK